MKLNLEVLIEKFGEESEFGNDLDEELRRIPKLHNKYYSMLAKTKSKHFQLKEEYEEKKHLATLYLTGKASDDKYKEKRLDIKISNSELPMYLAADPELRKMRNQLETIKNIKDALSEIVSQINERKWIIKSLIDVETIKLGIRG